MHLSDCTTFEPIIRLSQTSSQLTKTRRLTTLPWEPHPNTLINQTGRSSSTSFHRGSVLNSIIWWTTVRQGLTKPKWHARTCVIIGNRRKSLSAQPEVPGIHHRPCPLDQQRQRVECPKLCVCNYEYRIQRAVSNAWPFGRFGMASRQLLALSRDWPFHGESRVGAVRACITVYISNKDKNDNPPGHTIVVWWWWPAIERNVISLLCGIDGRERLVRWWTL